MAKSLPQATWYYDGLVPKRIVVRAAPAQLSRSRYDEDNELDPSLPVPVTFNGVVYQCDPGPEGGTLEEAKALADAEPWSPITWDEKPVTRPDGSAPDTPMCR